MVEENVLYGYSLREGKFVPISNQPEFMFKSFDGKSFFAVDEESAYKHILLIGSSGCGKTTTIKQILAQIRSNEVGAMRSESACFIFDTKEDYLRQYGMYKDGDVIIGNSRSVRGRSECWNIFEEVMADGNDIDDIKMNARDIAKELFRGRGSKTQPYFSSAATDIFAGAIIYFVYRFRDNYSQWHDNLNNKYLVDFLMRSPKDLSKYFSIYPDLKGLCSHLGDGSNNQALGVIGELRAMLYDCFRGVFAAKPKSGSKGFSVRKFIRNKQGHALFLEYDMTVGESLVPMYRLITDLAMKEAMGVNARGKTFFVLDELKLLPNVNHLDDCLNFGRSKGVCVVAGLQSAEQLYAAYGKEKGQVILGGFGNVFSYYSSDFESREYISKLWGPKFSFIGIERPDGQRKYDVRSGMTVEHWDISDLDTGYAVIKLSTQKPPFIFHFGDKI